MATRRERPARQSDLLSRVLIAIPAALFAILIVGEGGLVFALGIFALGVVALGELYTLMGRVRPVNLGGFLVLGGMIAAALYGDPEDVLLALAAGFPLVFWLSFFRPRREHVSWALAATFFAVLWVGIPMVYAVFLREAPHGDGLVVDVLIGTFLGDTAAYFGGRLYGRRPLAPRISPNKTVEGLVFGFVGGTMGFWFAGLYQDWLSGIDALIMGMCIAAMAPVGDLFESMVKRDLQIKDTGRAFGPHGGLLDRLDAVLFTVVVGYYLAVALVY
jgi:phosphatidate cytidylyltransferase